MLKSPCFLHLTRYPQVNAACFSAPLQKLIILPSHKYRFSTSPYLRTQPRLAYSTGMSIVSPFTCSLAFGALFFSFM